MKTRTIHGSWRRRAWRILAVYFAFLLVLPLAGGLGANADDDAAPIEAATMSTTEAEPASEEVVEEPAVEEAEETEVVEAEPVVEDEVAPAAEPVVEADPVVEDDPVVDEAPEPVVEPPAVDEDVVVEEQPAEEAVEEIVEEEAVEYGPAANIGTLAVDPAFWPYPYETITDRSGTEEDNVFVGGSKEDDLSTWVQDYASPTQNADIVNGYVGAQVVDGRPLLYVGLDRLSYGGNSGFFLELNQLSNTINANNANIPNRSVGDLRFVFPAGAEFSYPTVQRWDGANWVTVPSAGFEFQSDNYTAEFKVDVATLLDIPIDEFDCTSLGFSSFYLRSGASAQDRSQLKDFVTGTIDVDFCPELTIIKTDRTSNPLAGAEFRITPDPRDPSQPPATFTTDASGRIVIEDARPGEYVIEEIAAPPGYLLPPGEARSQTITVVAGEDQTVTFSDPMAPTLTKTATALYDVEYLWEIEKTVDGVKSVTYTVDGDEPTVESTYEVTVTMVDEVRTNHRLAGTITVTNPDVEVMANLTDQLAGADCTIQGMADGNVTLPVGISTFEYLCITDGDLGDIPPTGTNTATLALNPVTYDTAYPVVGDESNLVITATADYAFAADQVTNETVTITDTFPEFAAAHPGATVTVGESPKTFTYTKTHTAPVGECVEYTNTATIVETEQSDSTTVTICNRADLATEKNAITSLDRTYAWEIDKSVADSTVTVDLETGRAFADYTIVVTEGAYEDSNWQMTGTITVTNPNQFRAAEVNVSDATNIGGVCTVEGDAVHTATVPAGETVEFDYVCAFDEEPTSYTGTNTATVVWTDLDEPVSYTATFDITDWELTERLKETVVSDTFPELAEQYTLDERTLTWSAEGTTHTFTYVHEFVADELPAHGECVTVENTASLSTGGQDTVEVEICAEARLDLTVAKAVKDLTYVQDHDWTITKTVDPDGTIDDPADSGTTFSYTVTVTPTAAERHSATYTTVLTVTNPNTYPVTGVEVVDDNCTIGDDDTGFTLGAGETREITLECDAPSVDEPGTNQATIAWTWPNAETDSVASNVVELDFSDATVVPGANATVEVTDTFAEFAAKYGLVQVDAVDGQQVYTYSIVHTSDPGECAVYRNVAKVIGSGDAVLDEDGTTAKVCAKAPEKPKPEKPKPEKPRPEIIKPDPKPKPKPQIPTGAPEALGPNNDLVMAGAALLTLAAGAGAMASTRRRRS